MIYSNKQACQILGIEINVSAIPWALDYGLNEQKVTKNYRATLQTFVCVI